MRARGARRPTPPASLAGRARRVTAGVRRLDVATEQFQSGWPPWSSLLLERQTDGGSSSLCEGPSAAVAIAVAPAPGSCVQQRHGEDSADGLELVVHSRCGRASALCLQPRGRRPVQQRAGQRDRRRHRRPRAAGGWLPLCCARRLLVRHNAYAGRRIATRQVQVSRGHGSAGRLPSQPLALIRAVHVRRHQDLQGRPARLVWAL